MHVYVYMCVSTRVLVKLCKFVFVFVCLRAVLVCLMVVYLNIFVDVINSCMLCECASLAPVPLHPWSTSGSSHFPRTQCSTSCRVVCAFTSCGKRERTKLLKGFAVA